MASRPLVLPEPFNGEGSWDSWSDHFKNVAAVNKWDDAAKLLWLRVRLTDKAQTAYKKLTDAVRDDYQQTMEALKKRFEPKSKHQLYLAEFQSKQRKQTEKWADFGDSLRALADKAFPTLGDDAREHLALNRYLSQLDDPQVAFMVKQRQPTTVDDAVSATLEMQSYVQKPPLKVHFAGDEAKPPEEAIVAAVRSQQETLMGMMQHVVERLDKLETQQKQPRRSQSPRPWWPRGRQWNRGDRRGNEDEEDAPDQDERTLVCWKCGLEVHYARGCAARVGVKRQGNGKSPQH